MIIRSICDAESRVKSKRLIRTVTLAPLEMHKMSFSFALGAFVGTALTQKRHNKELKRSVFDNRASYWRLHIISRDR